MTDDDGSLDPEPIQHLAQDCRLELRRAAVTAFAFAPAHARPVDENDAATRGQLLAQIEPHVFEIAARAMDKNDGRRFSRRRSELDHVLTHAPHFNEAAARRMSACNQPRPDRGDERAKRDHDSDDDERMHFF
jgi:hypothetical protein